MLSKFIALGLPGDTIASYSDPFFGTRASDCWVKGPWTCDGLLGALWLQDRGCDCWLEALRLLGFSAWGF